MERRNAIKNIGFSVGAMVISPSVLSLLQSCQKQEEPWRPSFYTEEQGIFVKNLINTLLPSVDDLPGAVDVKVHIFVDKFIQEVLSVDDKPGHRALLDHTMNAMLKLSGKEHIKFVSDNTYNEFLDSHLKKSKDEHEAIMGNINRYLDDNPNDMKGLGEKSGTYLFLSQLRDMSIWGYKNSETVGETVLAYTSVPGEQQGCVDLQATTGGKAWSLTW